MKLNNKGFAITAVLYGLLILFVILVSSYLLILSVKKDRVEDLVSSLENSYSGTMRKLNEHIYNLYTNANKVVATNNGIEYNYALSVSLMNDRLGGTTSDFDDGNLRYFGATPNNYIYFNCDTYPDQNCELWRIIGVFEDKVKIIRDESIGGLAWDHDKNQGLDANTYSSNWETSSLQQFLNGLYYDSEDKTTHMYYSWYDGSVSTSVDLKEKGIKPSTRNLISESVWYLGGTHALENIYPNDLYQIERTESIGETIYGDNPFTITANVGLMYISDYGYGTNLTKCNEDILNYNNTDTCRTDNWIYNDKYQWLITPNSIFSNNAATARDAGNVWSNVLVYSSYEVRPTLYLDENIYVNNVGDGTIENPYQIYYR